METVIHKIGRFGGNAYCSDCTFNHCNHTPVYN